MNEIKEYANKLAEAIGGEVVEITKNNGVVYTGVRRKIDVDSSLSVLPILYIDEIYDKMSIEDAVARYDEYCKNVPDTNELMGAIRDWEKAKEFLTIRLVNEKNIKDANFYRSAAEYGFSDLIMIPYISADDSSVRVSDTMLDIWEVSIDEVFEVALDNIEPVVESLADVLKKMGYPGFLLDATPQMYVISNPSKCNGASAVLKARKRLQEIFPDGYVVLPSSIHECLATEFNDDMDKDEVKNIVCDVNSSQVSEEEQLSDDAYVFRKEDFE